MSNPLTYLRALDYVGTRSVALIQTGPAAMLPGAVAKLREVFPGCAVAVVVHESDAAISDQLGASRVTVAAPGQRRRLVRALRQTRYDVVAMLLVAGGTGDLGAVPFLLRTRTIVALNESFDHFPLTAHRLEAIAQHVGVATADSQSPLAAARALLRDMLWRAAVAPFVTGYLLACAARLRIRSIARQRVGSVRPNRRSSMHRATDR